MADDADACEENEQPKFDLDLDAFEKDMVPVLKEGFLRKRKQKGMRVGGFGSWQKRYFVISNKRKQVIYGKNAAACQDSKGKKFIPWEDIEKVRMSTGKKSSEKEFEIVMKTDQKLNAGRSFILEGDTRREAEEWVAQLNKISLEYQRKQEKKRKAMEAINNRSTGRFHDAAEEDREVQ